MTKVAKESSLSARAAWFFAARTLAFALSFGLPLLLVRRLDQHEFGLYKQVFLLVMTTINVLPLGVEMSAFYFLPRLSDARRRSEVITNILFVYFFATGAAGLGLVLFPSMLSSVLGASELSRYAPLIAVLIPLWGTPFVLETIAIANQETRLASGVIVLSELGKSILLVAAVMTGASVQSLIIAGLVHGFVQSILLIAYCRKRFPAFLKVFHWNSLRTQLSYALPFGLAAILFRLQTDLPNYFVSHNFNSASYAIYAIGSFSLPFISILGYSVSGVLIPQVNQLEKTGARTEIIGLVARMMRKLAAVYLPIYFFLLVMGREFIELLFTAQYLSSWPIFLINLTMIPIAIVTTANDAIMRAHAEHRFFLVGLRFFLIPLLVLTLWFLSAQFALVGVIAAVIGISLIEASATGMKVIRILRVSAGDFFLLKDVFKVGAAAVCAGLTVALLKGLMAGAGNLILLVGCGLSFSLVYLTLVLLAGVVTESDRALIARAGEAVQNLVPRRRTNQNSLLEES